MNLKDLAHNAAHWLSGQDDAEGMIVSCRARLARNLAGAPFAPRATVEDQERVIEQVLEAARCCQYLRSAVFFKMNALAGNERRLLVERHLISPALADSQGQRGVLFNRDEALSAMLNEEDHLRLQAIVPGLRPLEAWSQVNALDDELGSRLEYAHSGRWGFLTACPTNTGTGLRVSVLMHLPALVLTEDMERVMRGLTQLAFTVRGFYGEGTNALGNLFQVSNQTTLGRGEEETVQELAGLARQLIACEREAQESLMAEAPAQVEDKVWRAYGLLAHARVLNSQEFMNLLSAVRLGRTLGLLKGLPSSFMNQLMVLTQPCHLQAQAGGELTPEERDVRRARLVRERLAALSVERPSETS
jgi:protein arginine kinase